MDPSELRKLYDLITASVEGDISPEQFSVLKQMLRSDPQAIRYYVDYMNIFCGISASVSTFNQDTRQEILNRQFWDELANYEKQAQAIKNPPEETEVCTRQKVEQTGKSRKISLSSRIFLLAQAAAVLLIVIYIFFIKAPAGIEVATLTDSTQAKWADTSIMMQTGTRLAANGDPILLREGLAEFCFDNHARIVIEAPAEFMIVSMDRVKLHYGKIYASVPQEALGFSILTQNAEVLDLGTEFGVQADINGDTLLQVIKGKTRLTTGKEANRIRMEVHHQHARKIDGATAAVSDIPYERQFFVRAFDSAKNTIWKGPSDLSLADIAAGGNGLGTAPSNVMLHPAQGITTVLSSAFAAAKEYYLLPDNPLVDGLFVPDGRQQQIISSRGDSFSECPPTSGLFDNQIVVNPQAGLYQTDRRSGTILFNGQPYGENGRPCIVMHSNLGITFDLEAIRHQYRGDLVGFTSQIGIADLQEPYPCNADFWVLVDGKVRYSQKNVREKGLLWKIAIELNETNRFLTLVTTDGGDLDDPKDCYTRAIACDWCVFAEPVLEFN